MANYYAIVPAAGSGARFGAAVPKQYLPLAGRPMIYHALHALCRFPAIERVLVVLAPDDEHWATYDWRDMGPKLETAHCGGATRAESVLNGLRAMETALLDDDWVLVHDAARPCLSDRHLQAMVDGLADEPVCGILAVPLADTLKLGDASQRVERTLPRDGLWQAQTPQMFRAGQLRQALETVSDVTDEAGAIEAMGLQPRLIRGDTTNFKVTYPADHALAEIILRGR